MADFLSDGHFGLPGIQEPPQCNSSMCMNLINTPFSAVTYILLRVTKSQCPRTRLTCIHLARLRRPRLSSSILSDTQAFCRRLRLRYEQREDAILPQSVRTQCSHHAAVSAGKNSEQSAPSPELRENHIADFARNAVNFFSGSLRSRSRGERRDGNIFFLSGYTGKAGLKP